MAIIGIVLGLVAIGLFIWLKKQQQISDGLHEAELDHTHHGMNAMMDNFNNYQVKTDRKIAELEKIIKKNQLDQNRRMDKAQKELPSVIGRVVGQIEFAQDKINR